jgi:hypothetical protein
MKKLLINNLKLLVIVVSVPGPTLEGSLVFEKHQLETVHHRRGQYQRFQMKILRSNIQLRCPKLLMDEINFVLINVHTSFFIAYFELQI